MNTVLRHTMTSRPHREMMEKSHLRETFFSLKNVPPPRPDSVHTEFMETDWDDDDILSEPEDGQSSPSLSLYSSGGWHSMTTLSTYDEIRTPEQRSVARFDMGPDPIKPIVGPRGPHLFRSSISSAGSLDPQHALSLSPVTPKVVPCQDADFRMPINLDVEMVTPRAFRHSPFRFTNQNLDMKDLALWSPEMVAQCMLGAGVELQFAEKFVENDINGAILITLKFEDLKELGIASFGVRTKVWDEINAMKDIRATSPDPETPIEDEPSREVKREERRWEREDNDGDLKRRQSSRRRKQLHKEDTVQPGDSVSIVGIEQVMPKPHHCSKGEKCRKWQRQQRLIEAFKKDHPFVNMDSRGIVMIAGDPGNPETARAIKPDHQDVALRPVSDAVPSVVASSDIFGTEGVPPLQYLQQATLWNGQPQQQQENVRQFLELQNTHVSSEVPPTPPFEMLPPRKPPHERLKALSKLSIPTQNSHPVEEAPGSACPGSAMPTSTHPFNQASQPQHLIAAPQRLASLPSTASPDSRSQTPRRIYRFGTAFSEIDLPNTAVPIGPVARHFSQSVPPEMNYHSASNPGPRSVSRATSARPSFTAMPPLDENMASASICPRHNTPSAFMTKTSTQMSSNFKQARSLQPPPRVQWPWSPPPSTRQFETAIAPIPKAPGSGPHSSTSSNDGDRCKNNNNNDSNSAQHKPSSSISSSSSAAIGSSLKTGDTLWGGQQHHAGNGERYQYQGYMKKRKTKMLRYVWQERYITLQGTRLAVQKDEGCVGRTLEYVDVDDYAIACSSLATTSKLNVALKAMSIRKDKGISKRDIAAFSFQLIPQADLRGGAGGGIRLRKRESSTPAAAGGHDDTESWLRSSPWTAPSGVNGTGKTHHFAVKSIEERIDWMRELMLARAHKQKGKGFEVSVNGSMI